MPARDVFICHAHQDKTAFARPLAEALGRLGVSCWVDEAAIAAGDSIIEAVGEGLESARFVIVLFTERLLARNWPQAELRSALSREIRTAVPVVIPVLSIPHDEFMHRYPLLADKLALQWADGVEAVADRIAVRFDRRPAVEWHHTHRADYVGTIWTRVVPSGPAVAHTATLRWGPYLRSLEFDASGPICLVHHKTEADNVMLHVSVEPAAIVTFGEGPAPDASRVNIDQGWSRTSGTDWPTLA